jgi:hypothetical protein
MWHNVGHKQAHGGGSIMAVFVQHHVLASSAQVTCSRKHIQVNHCIMDLVENMRASGTRAGGEQEDRVLWRRARETCDVKIPEGTLMIVPYYMKAYSASLCKPSCKNHRNHKQNVDMQHTYTHISWSHCTHMHVTIRSVALPQVGLLIGLLSPAGLCVAPEHSKAPARLVTAMHIK